MAVQILNHRMQVALDAGQAVVLCGDLNIAAHPLDHCRYRADAGMGEFVSGRPDRAWLATLVERGRKPAGVDDGGMVDLYRHGCGGCFRSRVSCASI